MADSDSGPEEISSSKTSGSGGNRHKNSTVQVPTIKKRKSLKNKEFTKQQHSQRSLEKNKKRRRYSKDESESDDDSHKIVKVRKGTKASGSNSKKVVSQKMVSDDSSSEEDSEESDSSTEIPGQGLSIGKTSSRNIKKESTDESEEEEHEDGDNEDGDNTEDESVEEADSTSETGDLGDDQTSDVEDSGNANTDEGYDALRKELSNMPFDELQQLKEKIGIKLYNQVMFKQEPSSKTEGREKRKFKRENKNRPMEMTSKRKTGRLRQVVPVKKRLVRDPRFDDLSGDYREDIFKSTYSFITDVKKNEKLKVLKQLEKEKDDDKKKELEYLVRRMTAQEMADRNKDQQQQRDRQRKKQEKLLVSDGKQPFYLKKADKKKLELADKYRELQKSGKVDTYLSKKRKKNAQKERRNLPAQQ